MHSYFPFLISKSVVSQSLSRKHVKCQAVIRSINIWTLTHVLLLYLFIKTYSYIMNICLKGWLSALIWGYSHPNWRKGLQLFNVYHPLFEGTINDWITDLKAASWTGMGNSFVISSSIKQVKCNNNNNNDSKDI